MKKIIVCYFASVGFLLGFTLALNMNQIPVAVLMGALFVGCMLWFTELTRLMKRKRRRSEREDTPQETYRIDIPLDDEPEDKPAGSVRPGSCPSATYAQMKATQESAS